MFTKAISEGQLLSSSGINTIMGDIDNSWGEVNSNRFINWPYLTESYGCNSVTHFYYLNPGGDVYIQLKRLKLDYKIESTSYIAPSCIAKIVVWYNVGGGDVSILNTGAIGTYSFDCDLAAIPASTSSKSTDAYIKVYIIGGVDNYEGLSIVSTYYSKFRLQYTVSDSI